MKKLTIQRNEVGAWYVKETTGNIFRYLGSFPTRAKALAFKAKVKRA